MKREYAIRAGVIGFAANEDRSPDFKMSDNLETQNLSQRFQYRYGSCGFYL